MNPLIVRPAAREDVRQAGDWLEGQRVGLGSRFEAAVAAKLRDISERPLSFPKLSDSDRARRALVDGFPYIIIFVDLGHEIRVVMVVHAHRDPKAMLRRVSQDDASRLPRNDA